MRVSALRRPIAVLAALTMLAPLAGCTDEPGPDQAAEAFLATLAGGDTASASQRTDAADSARSLMDKVRGAIKPESVTTQVTGVETTEGSDSAKAKFTITWNLGGNRTWSYPSELELRTVDDQWKVHWSTTVLHPKLAEQQSIAVQEQQPQLAPVLDRDGEVLLEPDRVVSVLLEAKKAGDLPAVAGALAKALAGFDNTITQQSIIDGANAAKDGTPYQVVALRDGDYELVKPQIYDLPGVRFTSGPRLLPTDKTLAPQLLPSIRRNVEKQLTGKSGWRVVTVDASGTEVEELYAKAAEPAQAATAALSRKMQSAAQAAIAGEQTPAMIVAMQPSTGELLAVAQNPAADKEGPVALTGRYPPGSTFKIITAAAVLASGKLQPDTPVDCPGTTTIEGRLIPNSGRFEKGTIPLHSAFAFSCNTTFARLAADMGPDELTTMAKRLGIGADFVMPEVTTVTGAVPPATSTVERAEDGFGQGKVVASPFGMALVAATVATGTMPKPVLVRGAQTTTDSTPEPVAAPVLGALREMMREVVTVGTAGALAGFADVRGKTGTAQFGDGSQAHGWFAGYQGDLAFAVLITDAGESLRAVQATARFLGALS